MFLSHRVFSLYNSNIVTCVWSFTCFQCQLNIDNANIMPCIIRVSVKWLNCVTFCLTNTLFIYVFKFHNHGARCYKKRQAENKSYKIKLKALKELEKGTPQKDVSSFFRLLKNTLSTWKKSKDKIFEKYSSGPILKSKSREVWGT